MTFHQTNIYDPTKADDPKAREPWQRANQLCQMCATLIRASDSAMNIDFAGNIIGQLEVMHQLADELRQHLDTPTPIPALAPAAPVPPAERGKARPISVMYDAILRAHDLAIAAEALAYDRCNLTEAGSPPVLALLDMVKDELAALSEDISELEHVERGARLP